jgi:hypothetical protein
MSAVAFATRALFHLHHRQMLAVFATRTLSWLVIWDGSDMTIMVNLKIGFSEIVRVRERPQTTGRIWSTSRIATMAWE